MIQVAPGTKVHLACRPVSMRYQSTMAQVERHRELTDRQYALVEQARRLGWAREEIAVIDDDLGFSGASTNHRNGFARMTAEVALGRVGIVLGLEVSRLARNNADWYRLLDLCGMTDTLIGDADGVYHPGAFNDRLALGLKGTMSEAELHVLRARLKGGIRNKAVRGELRRALPVGLVWGDADGEVRFHPDEAVTGVIRIVFERFAELGAVRRVWLWLRSQNLAFPSQISPSGEIRWGSPTYTAIHRVLTNPVYAGAYAYGKSRHERYVDDQGVVRQRVRRLSRAEWAVFLPDHHEGFIDWLTYEANQARIGANTRPQPHQSGGAVREGAALLQGIATCGHCGRRLRTHYRGTNATPGYHCAGKHIVEGRGVYCLSVGGVQIDQGTMRPLRRPVAHVRRLGFALGIPHGLGSSCSPRRSRRTPSSPSGQEPYDAGAPGPAVSVRARAGPLRFPVTPPSPLPCSKTPAEPVVLADSGFSGAAPGPNKPKASARS